MSTTLSMQANEPQPASFASPLARHVAATRPAFLTVTLAGMVLGAAASGGQANAALLVAGLAVLLLHAAVNVANDYFDHLSGGDAGNTQRLFPFTGGSRFIQNHVMTPRATLLLAVSLFAATAVLGGGLVWQGGGVIAALGGAGAALGWAYSAPPLRLNGRGWGELTVALTFWGVPLGAAQVVAGHIAPAVVWLGGSYALLVTALLYLNQFPDRAADAAVGKRHWVVRLPLTVAPWGYVLLTLAAYGGLGWAGHRGVVSVPVLAAGGLTLPVSVWAASQLIRHAAQPAALRPAIVATISAANVFPLAVAATLWGGY